VTGTGDRSGDHALAAMLDLLPERVACYRLSDLTVVYCNAAKAADYGLRPDEMMGRRLDEILDPDRFGAVRDHLRRLGPDEPVLRVISDLRRPGQPLRWIEWVDRWQPGAEAGEILSVGRDVTEAHRRELELADSEERFRLSMADAPIGMAIVGLDGRFLQVNAALCELLGRPADELLTMTTLDVTHPEDVEADLSYGHTEGAPDPAGLEKRYVRPDGTVVWGLLKASKVRDAEGNPRYLIGQVVDITARIEQETQLRWVAEAERHVAERLRHVDQVKNTFLTAVSHELRTPLTVVRGMAATLRRLGDAVDGDTRASLERAIERHAERLQELLDELLDVDRLSRGAVTARPEPVELVELVRRTVDESTVSARTLLRAPDELHATVDPVQIERIVVNLLDNAAKYAPDGDIAVKVAPMDAGGFRLEVHDEGPGVPTTDHERIFEPFHRSENEHPRPGTGVGLALVAEFAQLHGGRAWVAPSSRGARLVVEVPGAATG
jgi:PAS domain S-box-containing protein